MRQLFATAHSGCLQHSGLKSVNFTFLCCWFPCPFVSRPGLKGYMFVAACGFSWRHLEATGAQLGKVSSPWGFSCAWLECICPGRGEEKKKKQNIQQVERRIREGKWIVLARPTTTSWALIGIPPGNSSTSWAVRLHPWKAGLDSAPLPRHVLGKLWPVATHTF